MELKSILLSLLAPAAALVAVPAMAQAPAAPDASLPACSAKVTDHCMQRSGGHMAGHHKMAAHHAKHHAKARHHHKAMMHHAAAKAAPKPIAAPAPAAAKPAKPKR